MGNGHELLKNLKRIMETEAVSPSPFAIKDAIGQAGTEQLFCGFHRNLGLAKFFRPAEAE